MIYLDHNATTPVLPEVATILTGWMVRHGEDFPRLTTCYID